MAEETDELDDEIITCWCGAQGTYEELFDESGLPYSGCGGTGYVECDCGGDQCVCHHHGETECPGCPDCDFDENDWDDDGLEAGYGSAERGNG